MIRRTSFRYSHRSVRRSASAVVGAVTLGVCLAPTPAMANAPLPPGVHVDPGSPANKQYQIPIPAARQETAGSTGSTGGSSNPPLFGVGIKSSAAPASGPGQTTAANSASSSVPAPGGTHHPGIRSSAASSRHTRTRAAHHSAAQSSTRAARTTRTYEKASEPGSSSWLPLVIGGALVLIVGGGGGLGLRRRHLRG